MADSPSSSSPKPEIDWTIQERNGRPCLFWDGEYCRVATEPEIALGAKLRASEASVESLRKERDAAKQETEDEITAALRLGDLLRRTCDALKGPHPDPLTLHSWHDLPEVATALRKDLVAERAFCICGCPAGDHESYGEDGEACQNEAHECIRAAAAVVQIAANMREAARAEATKAERRDRQLLLALVCSLGRGVPLHLSNLALHAHGGPNPGSVKEFAEPATDSLALIAVCDHAAIRAPRPPEPEWKPCPKCGASWNSCEHAPASPTPPTSPTHEHNWHRTKLGWACGCGMVDHIDPEPTPPSEEPRPRRNLDAPDPPPMCWCPDECVIHPDPVPSPEPPREEPRR